ncbi:MAG: isoprenyl transferase [Trichlorobacter sp.]|jgi:undecaprenyl diphosphate synthase
MLELDPTKLPNHLAIIMDGNGRWAQQRMLKRIVGHQRGVETVRMVVEQASLLGIRYLTLFAFSSENWSRPKTEVRALMGLLKRFVRSETSRMMKHNIRFNVIGNRLELPEDINQSLDEALTKTAGNNGMVLTLALSYGGRQEIARAASRIAREVARGTLHPDQVNDDLLGSYLDTGSLPDPDFLIRTSGEMRISNFLLWQLAYTELYFTDINWPDFTMIELHRALADFQARERRFGKTSAQIRLTKGADLSNAC